MLRKISPKNSRLLNSALAKNQKSWFPLKTFELLQRLISWWAIELVITRANGREILLTKYDGKYFHGQWHIPGGFALRDETFQATGDRVARRELGVGATLGQILDVYKWKKNEHPIGRPLSLYCDCCLDKPITPTAAMKYFSVRSLPKPLVACHRRFITAQLG